MSIQAKNINKSFYKNNVKIDALLDFTVDIPQGSIFGLLGPNGAGKSTFINILAGLVKKDSGEILVEGINHDKELARKDALLIKEGFKLSLPNE